MNKIKLLYIDLFCGAGGTTTGIEEATLKGHKCAKVIACINHDPHAIASHEANHHEAVHFTEDIRTFDLSPLKSIIEASKVRNPKSKLVLHASLECTNFSKAKGGKPRDADSRTLAEHLYRYIENINPDYIQIENVEEFMSWGELDENGKPVSWHKGCDYIHWVYTVCGYGYTYDWRILNAADYGAYTCRKRYFAIFSKIGLKKAFPVASYRRKGSEKENLFGVEYKSWKPVREVLDLEDEGESIFARKKPLAENTLKRIYAGLIKFVAGGKQSFLVKWNSMNQKGKYNAPGIDDPCPTISTQNRIGIAKAHFLSKQFSGDENSKNISVDGPSGTITCRDHHALITYYGNGNASSIDMPSPTITTKDRIAKVTFIQNEYGNGFTSSLDTASPTLTQIPKQKLVSCFLMNPQYKNAGGSVDAPCFTLIARMDKMPPYLVSTEKGIGVVVNENDSPMTVKIKEFMALYGIIDIKMRMLKLSELKAIMGFPKDYILVGTMSEKKKYIGNAVEVNMSRKLCEALAEVV